MTFNSLCLVVLKTLRNHPDANSHDLFQLVASDSKVFNARNQNELSERDILESFASLIDSGYINGHYLWETKSGPVFSIEGITPEGLKLLD